MRMRFPRVVLSKAVESVAVLDQAPHGVPAFSLGFQPSISAMVVREPQVSLIEPVVSNCPPAPSLPALTPISASTYPGDSGTITVPGLEQPVTWVSCGPVTMPPVVQLTPPAGEVAPIEPVVVQAGPEVGAVVPEISNCPPYLGEPTVHVNAVLSTPAMVVENPTVAVEPTPEISNCPPYLGEPSVNINVDPTPEISNCPPYLGEPTINVSSVLSTTAMVVENPPLAVEPTPEISNCPPYLGEPGVTIHVDPTPEISNCPPYPGPVSITLGEVLTQEESAPTWIACGPVSMEPASVTTVVSIACEPIVSVITELPIDFVEVLPVM